MLRQHTSTSRMSRGGVTQAAQAEVEAQLSTGRGIHTKEALPTVLQVCFPAGTPGPCPARGISLHHCSWRIWGCQDRKNVFSLLAEARELCSMTADAQVVLPLVRGRRSGWRRQRTSLQRRAPARWPSRRPLPQTGSRAMPAPLLSRWAPSAVLPKGHMTQMHDLPSPTLCADTQHPARPLLLSPMQHRKSPIRVEGLQPMFGSCRDHGSSGGKRFHAFLCNTTVALKCSAGTCAALPAAGAV